MSPGSRQKFVLYGKTFIVPALFILFVTGLINRFYNPSGSDRSMKSIGVYTARLETMADRVESVRDVKRLQEAFCCYIESGRRKEFMNLLAGNFTLDYPNKKRDINGIIELFLNSNGGVSVAEIKDTSGLCAVFQPVVTLEKDGKRAKGRFRFYYVSEAGEKGAEREGGIFENEYILENGDWKIEIIRFYPESGSSYGHDAFVKKANAPIHYIPETAGSPITESNRLPDAGGPGQNRINTYISLKNLFMRAQILADENEVKNLQNRYGYYFDRKLWNNAANLFTRDAVLQRDSGKVYSGRRNIGRALEEAEKENLRKGNQLNSFQIQSFSDIAVSGINAQAEGVKFVILEEHGKIRQQVFTRFNAEYIKQYGVWLIRSMQEFHQSFENDDNATKKSVEAPEKFKSVSIPESQRQDLPIYDLNSMAKEIEQNLRRAVAYEACENLVSTYGYYIHESSWNELSEIFTQKGWNDFLLTDAQKKYSSGYIIQPVINVSKDGESAHIQARLFDAFLKGGRFHGAALLRQQALIKEGIWKIDGLDMENKNPP